MFWSVLIIIKGFINIKKKTSSLYVCVNIIGSSELLLGLGRFFNSLISYTVVMTAMTGDQPVTRPLPT
jgi:hypothetical protein